jgi:hypothetical protein
VRFWLIVLWAVLAVSASPPAGAQSAPPTRGAPPVMRPAPAAPALDTAKPPSIGAMPRGAPPVPPSSELVTPSDRTPGTTESGRTSVDGEPQRPGGR